jgi:hypothetical protein
MSDTTHKAGVHLPIYNVHVPTVCTMLRTRGGTDDQFDGVDWRHGRSMTAAYWCLATMESVGPDEQYAHAQQCRQGRRCFHKASE